MEVSTTTMTTATTNPNNNIGTTTNQPSASNMITSPATNVTANMTNINNNITGNSRPSNGNDCSQSYMQKQSTLDQSSNNNQITLVQDSVRSIDQSILKQTTDSVVVLHNNGHRNNTIGSYTGFQSTNNSQICSIQSMKPAQAFNTLATPNDDSFFVNEPVNIERVFVSDIKETIETILDRVEAELMHCMASASSQSSSLYVNDESLTGFTSFVRPLLDVSIDDDYDNRPKDIVTLRNLELTPPPTDETTVTPEPKSTQRRTKRTLSESTSETNEDSNTEGRSKRQRKQTQLFQVVTTKETRKSVAIDQTKTPKSSNKSISSSAQKQTKTPAGSVKRGTKSKSPVSMPLAQQHLPPTPTPPPQSQPAQPQLQPQQLSPSLAPPMQIPPDVIFYEKNDYLAIRNEENSFYLCQLTESVRIQKDFIKIRWLDTKDDGKSYFLTAHYDKIPQKSIIMPVLLEKLKSQRRGEQRFSLDDQNKDNIMDRLKRSLNIPADNEQP